MNHNAHMCHKGGQYMRRIIAIQLILSLRFYLVDMFLNGWQSCAY